MNCKEATDLFSEHRMETLPQAKKQALEEHLNHCQSCQKAWKAYSVFFADTGIENDFLIPSQLNAKIKYTIHEANNKKKVPFFRSKQVLSYATTCCFLLVAGIFGASHFGQLQENINTPYVATVSDVQKTEAMETTAPQPEFSSADTQDVQPTPPAVRNISKPTPAPKKNNISESTPENVTTPASEPLADMANQKIAPASEEGASGGGGASLEAYNAYYTITRQVDQSLAISEYPADLTVSAEFQTTLLENYPHTELTASVYSITITKAELEEILEITTELEERTEYIIAFSE